MTENQSESTPSKGVWVLDDTGKHLKFIPEEEVDQNAIEVDDNFVPTKPSAEAIQTYLSALTPTQKKMQDGLRGLDWNDAAIHNLLTIIEEGQRYNCARLRQKGYTEAEIARLDALSNENVIDFSHLRRGLVSPADEDWNLQVYLLKEVNRRRFVMLGKNED